jgi:purine catabolism regulator
VLQRALSAHERLERIVLSERGLDGVAGALAALIGGPAIDLRRPRRGARAPRAATPLPTGVDALGRRAARARRAGAPPRLRARRRARRPRARAARRAHAAGQAAATARAAGLARRRQGRGPLSEFDRLTLHQAVTIVALELLRRRVADDTERRLAGDVLTAMVSGELDGAELAPPAGAVRLRDRAGGSCSRRRGREGAAEDALARALREEARPALAAGTGPLLVRAAAAGAAATTSCSRSPSGCGARVARSRRRARGRRRRAVAAGELRRALPRGALRAGGARARANGDGAAAALATYRDLGSFQLLLSLQDDEALRLFCDSILAPIEEGEGAYGGELMRSLEAFIECNGQWERARAQLYCHRHTLRYRIRRVEELTGRSLDSARDRIDFWLALRGRELIREPKRNRVKVGVPTEIKTDEYRVALTPAGVRELVEHGHEVVVQAGRGRGLGDRRRRLPSQGAQILPDAEACSARRR